MKLAHPKLSTDLVEATVGVMADDGELESAYVHDEAALNCNIAALTLIDVLVEGVQLTGSHFSRITARDVVFRRTDLSSAYLDNGMLVRVEFNDCRMTAVDLSHTAIHDVTFKRCKLDKANFLKADLRRVEFIDCFLEGVDLTAANLVAVDIKGVTR
jgi:uncharacterized protein YjbI with pentapeptide repeats